MDRDGNIITSSENVAFSSYKYYNAPPIDDPPTEFESKLSMDIYSFAHYNFSALRLHNQNISLRKFYLSMKNQDYNLLNFDKEDAYINSILYTFSKPTKYTFDDAAICQRIDEQYPYASDSLKECIRMMYNKILPKKDIKNSL